MKVVQRYVPDNALPDSLSRVSRRVLAARGIVDRKGLDMSLNRLIHTDYFDNLSNAANLLLQFGIDGAKILFVGDFDTDGATSVALAIRVLRKMGFKNLDYLVPDRFEFGYGLSPELVEYANANRKPDLIVTVDNGISSLSGVKYAKELGLKTIVTDHHLPGDELPCADAIVNPSVSGNNFPSKNLAGVGVVFYLLIAARALVREKSSIFYHQFKTPNLAKYLDLVALGTIADLVTLDGNNRRMVFHGLKLIRSSYGNLGIKVLLKKAKISLKNVKSSDLSFSVAPRLNAAGRLEDMSLGIECLLSDEFSRVNQISDELTALNESRKSIEKKMCNDAFESLQGILDETEVNRENGLTCFSIYKADWHQGVIGIVAARIAREHRKPTFIFADDKNSFLKGSARSVDGVHLKNVLQKVSITHPNLITQFGGHAMAAGLVLEKKKFLEFKEVLNRTMKDFISPNNSQFTIQSDGHLECIEYNKELVIELNNLEPWGQGFPEPSFDGFFDIIKLKVLKNEHVKLTLRTLGDRPVVLSAIAFNAADKGWFNKKRKVHAVFRVEVNSFKGINELQLIILHATPIIENSEN